MMIVHVDERPLRQIIFEHDCQLTAAERLTQRAIATTQETT
jgi:hypothetical protein